MAKSRKIFFPLSILLIAVIFAASINGCANNEKNFKKGSKLKIVTTIFPNYDFAKQIVKDKAEVILLIPPGVEAHSYDPTPKDIVNTVSADIFIYTGALMEPWADKIINSLNGKNQLIVESGKNIALTESEQDNHHDDDHTHGNDVDPHFWVNPLYAIKMTENIKDAVIKADPDNDEFYTDNYRNYAEKLKELDKEIENTLSKVKHKTIIYGGHFVFGYFSERYGLDFVSPYKGFSPDSEPTPLKIAELINKMNELDINVVFYEELVDPKIARVISEQTGADMLLLNGAHNVSKKILTMA